MHQHIKDEAGELDPLYELKPLSDPYDVWCLFDAPHVTELDKVELFRYYALSPSTEVVEFGTSQGNLWLSIYGPSGGRADWWPPRKPSQELWDILPNLLGRLEKDGKLEKA
jgi:hypothetical protein